MQSLDAASVSRALTATILQGDVSPASSAHLAAYLNGTNVSALPALSGENADERIRGAAYLTMAMPPTNSHEGAFLKRNAFSARCGQRSCRRRTRRWVLLARARPSAARRRRRPRAGGRQLSRRQRRVEHGRAVRHAGVLQVPPLVSRCAERGAAHQRHDRTEPAAQSVQRHVRQGAKSRSSRRRLSEADFSHFRSTEIWQTAAPDAYVSTGWLGRYLDGASLPARTCSTPSPWPTCCLKCWWPIASTWRRSRNSTATA